MNKFYNIIFDIIYLSKFKIIFKNFSINNLILINNNYIYIFIKKKIYINLIYKIIKKIVKLFKLYNKYYYKFYK